MLGLELVRALEADYSFSSTTRLEVVLAGDERYWPEPISKPFAYIINADKHWVCLYLDDKGGADYLDSYGTAPLECIYRWTKKRCCGKIRYNTICLQSPLSTVCGMYAVFFLRMRCRGYSLADILQYFDQINLQFNDSLVTHIFNKQ